MRRELMAPSASSWIEGHSTLSFMSSLWALSGGIHDSSLCCSLAKGSWLISERAKIKLPSWLLTAIATLLRGSDCLLLIYLVYAGKRVHHCCSKSHLSMLSQPLNYSYEAMDSVLDSYCSRNSCAATLKVSAGRLTISLLRSHLQYSGHKGDDQQVLLEQLAPLSLMRFCPQAKSLQGVSAFLKGPQ